MRKLIFFFTIGALWVQLAYANDGAFKLIKTIGDERDDYTILGLADAVLTENNDIYILNARGNFISRFNWEGVFIEKVGAKGQGPKDFFFPRCLVYARQKLYVFDKGNKRIAEMDTKTGKFEYYKERYPIEFSMLHYVFEGPEFLGIFGTISEKRGRIGIVDKNFNIQRSFFKKFPIAKKIKEEDVQFPKTMSVEKGFRIFMLNNRFLPSCTYSDSLKEVLVSFLFPDNPVRFFVYNIEGKLLREFSYTIKEKKYKFNPFVLEASIDQIRDIKKHPEQFEINVEPFFYQDHYVAILTLKDFKEKEKDPIAIRQICLIFNRKGQLVKEFPCNNNLNILQQCNGYILATIKDEDVEKLYIYKIDIK